MKKLCLIVVAALAATHAGAASADTLSYKFKSEKDVKDFKAYGAKWQVKSKAYGPIAGIALPTPSLVTTKKFKNVSARASVKKLDVFSRAGLMARAKVNGNLLFGYFGGLSHDSDTLASARILKFDNYNIATSQGVQVALCQAFVTLDAKSNVEFKVSGTSLGLYYNGLLVCSAEDASFKKGQTGLMASPLPNSAAASFGSASFED